MAEAGSPLSSLVNLAPSSSLGALPVFVELDEKYMCIVCGRPLQTPVQTPCGHRMCKSCLDQLFEDKASDAEVLCPGKEESCENITKTGVYPDFCAQRELKHQRVYCSNRDLDCPAVVTWGKLSAHEKTCGYKGKDCPYKELGCRRKIPEKLYDKHIYTECEYIPTPCKFCGVSIPKTLLEDHFQNQCPKAELACPYGCGQTKLRREQLQRHKDSCLSRPRICPLSNAGCGFQGSDKEIREHMEKNKDTHMELLSKSLETVQKENAEVSAKHQEVKNVFEQTQKTLTDVEKENKKLKQTVEKQEKRMQILTKTVASQSEKILALEEQNKGFARQDQVNRHEREIIKIKDGISNAEGSIGRLEHRHGATGGPVPEETRQKMMTHDRQLGIHDVRLAEVDLRFQCLETTSYNGTMIWRISDYARRKQEAISSRTLSLYSQPFFSSRYGYKMCARVYLNGDGMGKNTHMSMFFVVMRGEHDALLRWPFRQKVTMTLLDQDPSGRHLSDTFRPDPTSTSFRRPISEMNVASGCPLFVAHSTLEGKSYMKDDTIFIRVTIETSDLPLP